MHRLTLTVAAAVLATGCSHGAKTVKPCAEARADAAKHVVHGALRGDVDGDGRSDIVSLVRLRGNARCGAVLIVRTRSGTLSHAFRTVSFPGVPSLNGLAALSDPQPGLKIVITTWQGASTAFARVFAVRRSRISEIPIDTPEGTIPYEGSVTHFNAVDCGAPGSIVASGWAEVGASGRRFSFERRFYRVGELRFELARVQSGRTRSPLPERGRFPEFREPQPFPSCMRVRAAP